MIIMIIVEYDINVDFNQTLLHITVYVTGLDNEIEVTGKVANNFCK